MCDLLLKSIGQPEVARFHEMSVFRLRRLERNLKNMNPKAHAQTSWPLKRYMRPWVIEEGDCNDYDPTSTSERTKMMEVRLFYGDEYMINIEELERLLVSLKKQISKKFRWQLLVCPRSYEGVMTKHPEKAHQ